MVKLLKKIFKREKIAVIGGVAYRLVSKGKLVALYEKI